MNEFRQKGNVSDEVFMIHVLNNLPKEYNVILDGLENHVTTTGNYALTIDSICENIITGARKLKVKKKKKQKKALGAFNKQYKQRYQRCGKYGHKPGNWRCPENKNEREENDKKTEYKNRKFD